MKVVSSGSIFEIFGDDLKTYDKLPAGVYDVKFSQNRGFYLCQRAEMEINETKIYGNHNIKVDKVMNAFTLFNRNLGVILSGTKGIGKSLFARLLACKAISNGIPVIMIDKYLPGVASYINNIEQEVLILFDEFDKTYGDIHAADGMAPPQTELLSLFDGTSTGKKLFVITCNETYKLNEYLLNRPGRFHYHFRFDNPSAEEIREYLVDKLNADYYSEIDKVIAFAQKVSINFDCLRAIAFELNCGIDFSTAIKDLNIVNTNKVSCLITLHYNSGRIARFGKTSLDLFDYSTDSSALYGVVDGQEVIREVTFNPSNIRVDESSFLNVIDSQFLNVFYYDESDCKSEEVKVIKECKKDTVAFLTIERVPEKSIHYAV